MKPLFIGIAGGTGVGKSTVCFALADTYPDKIGVVHLDDYFNKHEQVPLLHGMKNWDHPNAINFEKLISDLNDLQSGKTITVMTKSERFNPRYKQTGKIPMEIKPKHMLLVEGYMVLWDPSVREFFASSIYLDVPYRMRIQRRTKFLDAEYQEKVLIPMHQEFVEPSKYHAKHVIEASALSIEQVTSEVEKIILKLM